MARRSDGSVVAWGDNDYGQCNVPALPAGLTYVEVAAGDCHTVARRSDGSVVAWGCNGDGQCNVPALPAGLTYVEVAAGGCHTVARRSDGSVVAWGDNNYGQCNVPALPAGLTYVEVAAGGCHTVARRSDGSVVAWGYNGYGQCNVPALPAGLTYVEVAAGSGHTVARRSDGSVVAWGDNGYGQCNVPPPPAGSPTSRSRRAVVTRWRAGATAPSSRGGTTPTASATCRRCRPGSPTSRSRRAAITRWRGTTSPLRSCLSAQVAVVRACQSSAATRRASGQDVFLTLTSGSPNAAGFLYGGGVPVAPYPLGSGCEVQVDLPSAIPFFPVMTDSTGTWSNALLIPPDHNLVGAQAALQIALFSTSGPLGFDLSNGLIVTVGYLR